MSAADILQWLTIIGILVGAYVGYRNLKPDLTTKDAGAAHTYMLAAQAAASEVRDSQKELIDWKERVERLELALEIKDKRIDELEAAGLEKDKKIVALQCEVNELREKIVQLEAIKNDRT